MKTFLSLLLIICGKFCFAQTFRTPVTSAYTSMGAYGVQRTDAFSFMANQAALANSNRFMAGLFGERRFLLNELAIYQAAIVMPTKAGSFGFNGNYFGYADCQEMQAGLAYGRKITDKVSAGVQFNYLSLNTNGYGNTGVVNVEAGVLFQVTPQLIFGLHSYNPNSVSIGKDDEERLPSIYTVSLGYETSDKFFAGLEIKKQEDLPVSVNVGLQYQFDQQFFARVGMTSGNSVFYVGAGVQLRDFRLDATASVHPHLGVTPGLMLLFKGKSKSL